MRRATNARIDPMSLPMPVTQRLFVPRRELHGSLSEELRLSPAPFGMGMLPARMQPDGMARSVCGFCSTGCALDLHLQQGAAVGLTPAVEYPVNRGLACPKGWEALTVLQSKERAVTPLLRRQSGRLEPLDWDAALRQFVGRMKAIQAEHGPEAVAFLSTGQIATEEMAYLGALTKFGMGIKHGDGNTRQCMATAVVAYKQAFGFDAPPYTYADLEASDVIVLIGSNLCIAHPILWNRVIRNPHRPEIIVIDPRATETSMAATQHLPLYPKSDLTLFYGVARLLIERGWIDRDFIAAHTSGFEAFADFVLQYPLDRVARETQLAPEAIERLTATIHRGKRVSFWWTMGVNQSHQGVRTAQAIINLAVMTGNIGRAGTGANSITGQCNAMGSRLFSNTTNLLGGHDFACRKARRKVASILDIDEARIPDDAGWPYHKIMEGILAGKIRGLWIVGTNPAHSWINQGQARDILDRLDFLVVQDMYANTETAHMADLILPAAGWGEKEGTFINSERRLGTIRKVSRAPGEALADFQIFRLIADYWGLGAMFARWQSPEDVFQMLKQLSRGQPCDFTGIEDYAQLDRDGGIQWPFPADREIDADATERRLFEDGRFFHPDGRARILWDSPRPLPEEPNGRYPLILLTGRGTAAQWHTQTRTAQSAVLRSLYPAEPYLEMHPHDAHARGITAGMLVTVSSQRGEMQARALLTPTIQPGQVFVPMHYEATNLLTDAVFDPHSSQPAYKACAVEVGQAATR
jgi:assimilatory nitrate reductase catalytic subunit